MHERERRNLLLDAVFVDLEIVLLQVGDELPLIVPGDDVGRHEIDGDPERGLPFLTGGRRAARGLLPRGAGGWGGRR